MLVLKLDSAFFYSELELEAEGQAHVLELHAVIRDDGGVGSLRGLEDNFGVMECLARGGVLGGLPEQSCLHIFLLCITKLE